MNFPAYTLAENYDDRQKKRYALFVEQLGDSIHFEEDVWVCNKRIRSAAEQLTHVSIRFTKIPNAYKKLCKYFAIMRLLSGNTVRTVGGKVSSLTPFFTFMDEAYSSPPISACNTGMATNFKAHLDGLSLDSQTKRNIWSSASNLLKAMDGFDGMKCKNPFVINPYQYTRKLDQKYIPESVANALDIAFMNESVDLYMRCIYWTLRLIPSRISEVVGMKIDCLKPFNESVVVFIPTWKQNGGYMEPVLRSIHLQNEGMAGYLIGLIREQQMVATALQHQLPKNKQGALFTYPRKIHYKDGTVSCESNATVMTLSNTNWHLTRICKQFGIHSEDGELYNVTSHQFRHNGISDRLVAGFTIEQIASMTGHHGDAMIWSAYSHLSLKPEMIVQRQRYVLEEPECVENNYILFGGRILNMDAQLEKRLLKNLRAHRVPGGICSDVTGCRSDMWNCIGCGKFVPDKDQLRYFEEQATMWQDKSDRFMAFPLICNSARRNVHMFEQIVKKLKDGEENEP